MNIVEFFNEHRYIPSSKKALKHFLKYEDKSFSKNEIDLYAKSIGLNQVYHPRKKVIQSFNTIPTLSKYKKLHTSNQILTCGIDYKTFSVALTILKNQYKTVRGKVYNEENLAVTLFYALLLHRHKNLRYDDVKNNIKYVSKPIFIKTSKKFIQDLELSGINLNQPKYPFEYIIFRTKIDFKLKKISNGIDYFICLMEPLHAQIQHYLLYHFDKVKKDCNNDPLYLNSNYFDDSYENYLFPINTITRDDKYLKQMFFKNMNIYNRKLKLQYNFYFFTFVFGCAMGIQRISILSIFALVLHKYAVAIRHLPQGKYLFEGYLARRYSNNIIDVLLYHFTYNTYSKICNEILSLDDENDIFNGLNYEMINLSNMLNQFSKKSFKLTETTESNDSTIYLTIANKFKRDEDDYWNEEENDDVNWREDEKDEDDIYWQNSNDDDDDEY